MNKKLLSGVLVCLLFLVCCLFPLNVFGTVLFSDGFESGNASAWSLTNGVPSFVNDAHCGSYAVFCGPTSPTSFVAKTFGGVGDVFARFYFKVNATADYFYIASLSSAGSNGVVFGMNNGQLFLRNLVNFSFYWGPTIVANQWYCAEFERVTGTGSGACRLWVDGSLVIERTGLTFSGDSSRFELGQTTSGSANVFVTADCAVVADSYIGLESEEPASVETVAVSLNSPEDESTLTGWTENFTYTPVLVGTSSFQNASLYIDGIRVAGNASALVNNTVNGISHTFSSNGTYTWSVQVFNSTMGVFPVANFSVTVAVYTASNYYYVNASVGLHGSLTPSGLVEVEEGANQDFIISPDAGYHVLDVQVDSVSVGAVSVYNFSSVTANHTITASFAINNYTITASYDGNSTITPSGAVVVDYGGSQEFTFNASEGYHVSLVLVDEVEVSTVSPYVFESVAENHTIAVYSEVDGVEPSPSPTVLPSDSGVVSSDVEGLAVLGLVFGLVAFSVAAVTFTRKKTE